MLKKIYNTLNYYFCDSIISQNKKMFIDLRYNYYGKQYLIRYPVATGPDMLRNLRIENQDNNDVTAIILKYAGPTYDFHGYEYTPADYGYNKLTVYEDENVVRVIAEREIINLN